MNKFHVEDHLVFPTEIRIMRWETNPGFNARLSMICAALFEQKIKDKRAYTAYNLWHETAAEILVLRDMFVEGMASYAEAFFAPGVMRDYDYEMHAWLRIDKPRQVQAPHTHPGTNLVATYYSQADIAARKVEGTGYGDSVIEGDLVVMDPRPAALSRLTRAAKTMSISPEPGMMIIMPSWAMHWVNPVSAGDQRICIANNMNFRKRDSVHVKGSFTR